VSLLLQKEPAASKAPIGSRGLILASGGKLRLARLLFEHSYNNRRETSWAISPHIAIADEAKIDAVFGFEERAKNQARQALKIGRGIDAEEAATQALALSRPPATRLLFLPTIYTRAFQLHVPLNPACIPAIRRLFKFDGTIRRKQYNSFNKPSRTISLSLRI